MNTLHFSTESLQCTFEDPAMCGYFVQSDHPDSYHWKKTKASEAGLYHPLEDATTQSGEGDDPTIIHIITFLMNEFYGIVN